MHRYAGDLRYTTDNSGRLGQTIHADFTVSFFPGFCSIRVDDPNAETSHGLTNKRFNYQARDSPVDLLARDKWRSWWFDRFMGTVDLKCPSIPGVPKELRITLICSWDPAFAVIEFQIDDTFYQISCRPRRGVGNWTRHRFTGLQGEFFGITPQDDIPPNNEPSSSSAAPIEDAPDPV